MSDIERKLASIQVIEKIEPIENADKLELATINGWKAVVGKGTFKPNDLCVYFEIDSFLPASDPRYAFLEKRFIDWQGKRGCRIKSMKLRGQLSQGLVLPIDDFPETLNLDEAPIAGDDLTQFLHIEKWEKPIHTSLSGKVRGNFPSFLRKTDQERIQNIQKDLRKRDPNEVFEVTQKMDGSSMTMYLVREDDDWRFGVCSRNLDLIETEGNAFWEMARKLNAEAILRAFVETVEEDRGIAVQGELIGPNIQDNPEKLTERKFMLFDIFNLTTNTYLSPYNRKVVNIFLGFEHVPILGWAPLGDVIELDDALSYAEGPSTLGNNDTREGVVFKTAREDGFSFKIISNQYLLNEKD